MQRIEDKLKEKGRDLINKLHLKIFGNYEYEEGKYKVLCLKHGLQEGYKHGWLNDIDCLICIKEMVVGERKE